MRKLLPLIFLLLINKGFAAISANCWWNHRAGGSSANGGGFVQGATGTDYSLQDSAQYETTTATTPGAGAVINDSRAASDMVGNILHIVSGTNFTAGWYQILSVSAGVSITVDRACCTGAGSDGVIKIGGAWGVPTVANYSTIVAGNKIWIKKGTYTFTEAISATTSGTTTSPMVFEGYDATRPDTPVGDNRPYFVIGAYGANFGQYWTHKNIRFSVAQTSGYYTGNYSTLINMSGYNSVDFSYVFATNLYTTYFGCYASALKTNTYSIGFGGNYSSAAIASVARGCGKGFDLAFVDDCIADSCVYGIFTELQNSIVNRTTIDNCTYGVYANYAPTIILNTTISNATTGVFVTSSGLRTFIYNSNLYNCTTDFHANVIPGLTKVNCVDVDPQFVHSAGKDFRIGTNLKALGFPGSFVNMGLSADCVSYTDIGAVQRQEPASGGGHSHTWVQ